MYEREIRWGCVVGDCAMGGGKEERDLKRKREDSAQIET